MSRSFMSHYVTLWCACEVCSCAHNLYINPIQVPTCPCTARQGICTHARELHDNVECPRALAWHGKESAYMRDSSTTMRSAHLPLHGNNESE